MSLQDVNTEDQNSFFVPTISHDITNGLKADKIIKFRWVPGHFLIAGNMKVDISPYLLTKISSPKIHQYHPVMHESFLSSQLPNSTVLHGLATTLSSR